MREIILVMVPLFSRCRRAAARRRSPLDWLRRHDLDAEAGQADIGHVRRGSQKPYRTDTEIPEDLRAETDLAPLLAARLARGGLFRFGNGDHRHPGGAVAQ